VSLFGDYAPLLATTQTETGSADLPRSVATSLDIGEAPGGSGWPSALRGRALGVWPMVSQPSWKRTFFCSLAALVLIQRAYTHVNWSRILLLTCLGLVLAAVGYLYTRVYRPYRARELAAIKAQQECFSSLSGKSTVSSLFRSPIPIGDTF
jgi:hypothetical protein